MPYKQSNSTTSAPIIQIHISVSPEVEEQYRKNGMKPPAMMVQALIDTGASVTCISDSVISGLKLEKKGNVLGRGINGDTMTDRYSVSIIFPIGNGVRFNIDCMKVEMDKNYHNVLIGRDILKHGTFNYDGIENTFTFDIPMKQ